MTWSPGRLILVGSLVLAGALLATLAGAGLRGPLIPSCPTCAPLASRALFALALVLAVAGAVLVGMGLARREPDNVEGGTPPSPSDDGPP